MSRMPRQHRLLEGRDECLAPSISALQDDARLCAVVKIRGDLYERLERLLWAIDDVAETITGDREYLWIDDPSRSAGHRRE